MRSVDICLWLYTYILLSALTGCHRTDVALPNPRRYSIRSALLACRDEWIFLPWHPTRLIGWYNVWDDQCTNFQARYVTVLNPQSVLMSMRFKISYIRDLRLDREISLINREVEGSKVHCLYKPHQPADVLINVCPSLQTGKLLQKSPGAIGVLGL